MADQERSKLNTWFSKAMHLGLKKSEVTKPLILDGGVSRLTGLGKAISVIGGPGGGGGTPAGTNLLLNSDPNEWEPLTATPGATLPTGYAISGAGGPLFSKLAGNNALRFDRNGAILTNTRMGQTVSVEAGQWIFAIADMAAANGAVAMQMTGVPMLSQLDGVDAHTTYQNAAKVVGAWLALADGEALFETWPSQATAQISDYLSIKLLVSEGNLLENADYRGGWPGAGDPTASTPPTGWGGSPPWTFSVNGDGSLVCARNGAGTNMTQTVACEPNTQYVGVVARSQSGVARTLAIQLNDNDAQTISEANVGALTGALLTTGPAATTLTFGFRPGQATTQTELVDFMGLFKVVEL